MTDTLREISVGLTRAERDLLIGLLQQAVDDPLPRRGRKAVDTVGHDSRYAWNYQRAQLADDLLDRLRRP